MKQNLSEKAQPLTAIKNYLFTSESVSEGHPDKICDQISDALVDAYLTEDPFARTAIEVLVTTNKIVIAGEVRGGDAIDNKRIEEVARNTIRRIGYEQKNFHWAESDIDIYLHHQSPDIAQGVDAGENKDEGAGDQGIMFGYACNETPSLMPAAIYYSHKILRTIADDIHAGKLKDLGPDAKSQVTLRYENGKPVKADSVVVSIQHKEEITQAFIRQTIKRYVQDVLPQGWMCDDDHLYVNPTGKFVIGGPDSDCGLTGRKIIVDTYGGSAPHGGGCFSGKDPSKVDRSAAYIARYLAKNVVAAGLADSCTIQLAYAIGVSKPLALYVNGHGTATCSEARIANALQELVDLTPRGIRTHLALNKPIYERTASYGHFGREPEADGGFSWERTDLVDALKEKLR